MLDPDVEILVLARGAAVEAVEREEEAAAVRETL
jgi:hypothetical protein